MFVLPDVAAACIAGVELVWAVVSVTFTVGEDEANTTGFTVTDFSSKLTETLKIILSYKLYFAFLWHNIYITCINIHSYMLAC